jgi:hypothetical protein
VEIEEVAAVEVEEEVKEKATSSIIKKESFIAIGKSSQLKAYSSKLKEYVTTEKNETQEDAERSHERRC